MKKRLAVTITALVLSMLMAVPVFAGTWKQVDGKWRYQRGANKYAYNEWVEDKGNFYYMGNDGNMMTGWQQIGGQWYYLDTAGILQTGWLKDNDKWYYLLPMGTMAVNTIIDGRWIGADGVWVPAEGQIEPSNITDTTTPYLVQNLEGISFNGYNIITSAKNSSGDRWTNTIRLKGKGSYVKYDAKGEYRLLTGTLAPSSQFDSDLLAKVTIYGDNDTVLYSSPDIHYNEKNVYFGVDVSDQNQIRVEVSLIKDNEWDDPIILLDKLALYK